MASCKYRYQYSFQILIHSQIQVDLKSWEKYLTVEEKISFNLNVTEIYVKIDDSQFVINGEWELLGNFLLERIFADFLLTGSNVF
jgi:hypothetical protein